MAPAKLLCRSSSRDALLFCSGTVLYLVAHEVGQEAGEAACRVSRRVIDLEQPRRAGDLEDDRALRGESGELHVSIAPGSFRHAVQQHVDSSRIQLLYLRQVEDELGTVRLQQGLHLAKE